MCAIQIDPGITTARLRLRAPRLSDASAIAKLLNDFDVASMTMSVPHPYGLEDAEAFLDQGDPEERFVIDHPEHGPVGLMEFELKDGVTELGYFLGKPFWGCGFATEAVQASLSWIKHQKGRRYVIARHFQDNPASGEVLIKSGFLYTGQVSETLSVARKAPVASRWMVWLA